MLHLVDLRGRAAARIRLLALVIGSPVALALSACERFEQKDSVPTYHDSKLDVMRSVTDQPLPTSHERSAIRAGSDGEAASATAAAPALASASAASARP